MKNCIPDELFNMIAYPDYGTEAIGLERAFREMRYKIAIVPDVTVNKEVWHSICDFCKRTGALLERFEGAVDAATVTCVPTFGRPKYVVGAGVTRTSGGVDGRTADVSVEFGNDAVTGTRTAIVTFANEVEGYPYAILSVQPDFSDDSSEDGKWSPRIPLWFAEKYGETIVHGALMRLFAMGGRPWYDVGLARMHAVAYNNDLNNLSFGLITSGMRKHMLVDIETTLLQPRTVVTNGNS